MEFYKQRKFNCQITGHSGLTFFEAIESERAGAAEVDQAFPEALKGPVLRRVQFQTVSRIDSLVDQIYDEFKTDYHPGEAVTVIMSDAERRHGIVRDKTRYGSKVLPDGTLTPPYTRYIVGLDGRRGDEAVLEESNIYRDRKVFTKSVLRSFIKKTVSREAWNGAPWLVKSDVAEQYHIDTRVPSNLLYNTKIMERKQLQAQKRQSQNHSDFSTLLNSSPSSPDAGGGLRLPELKPVKSHKAKHIQLAQQQRQQLSQEKNQLKINGHNVTQAPVQPPPPPPPPRYPIEDLQLEPSRSTRPALRFLCNDPPIQADQKGQKARLPASEKILMKTVGPLLETWDTLNVYCEIFKLDSFTFDDFIETLLSASDDEPVQLFDEIHCSVLKTLVHSEADGGAVQIHLPDVEGEDDEEDEEGEEEEEEEEEPEPEPAPRATRATRSSLAKVEAERLAAEAAAAEKEAEEEEAAAVHSAEAALEDYDWIDELRKRNFKEGGWQLILVGLLYQLSKDERRQAVCEELLAQIVPPNVEATKETVREHYSALDINYRVQVLQIICMLTMETKAVRGYMEDCSEQMTKYRKEKIEWQRSRKQAVEDLKVLNEQRKILLPDNMPPSPPQEATKLDDDVKMTDAEDLSHAGDDDSDDSGAPPVTARGRSLRRADDRAAERKRKIEEEIERKKEAEAAAKMPKQSKQFIKLLRDIEKKEEEIKECEDEIATLDNDLREADCPRTRVLGKDRFWNRYYWFERNGMPYGGLPTSSTAEAGYANGCIWVQGPDELEREGYIDMPEQYQKEYKAKFNMTVPERKKLEEGATSISNATQWGYFSEPKELDDLINWLDSRGFNEMKLRKELVSFREKIATHMQNRKKYLSLPDEEEASDDKEKETGEEDKDKEMTVEHPVTNGTSKGTSKRKSTRAVKAAPTPDPTPTILRCTQWTNGMALEDLGHLHSEPPPPARSRKQSRKKEAAPEEEPPRKKTRQGTTRR
ncbi:chromatin assembly protein [Sporothrix brasiliensis 5110]|uniref:Chromatin assembly protein n=1 Tax=Sporothrix brasiliensis 5110 TaxID=1398154 RepID=A0A0C2IVC1_9PEZI|nr:chromatin assembly protein [Sporothrix brasiliensis 5110]KIH93086.1 chromatin assembly protein [Sporothrix brasiliensis 5110]